MAVWRIPDRRAGDDWRRYLPKPPYVETRKCKAYRCWNRRSTSFPWIKDNPWCTEHSKQVYLAAASWMTPERQKQVQDEAKPPTNLIAHLVHKWKAKHG